MRINGNEATQTCDSSSPTWNVSYARAQCSPSMGFSHKLLLCIGSFSSCVGLTLMRTGVFWLRSRRHCLAQATVLTSSTGLGPAVARLFLFRWLLYAAPLCFARPVAVLRWFTGVPLRAYRAAPFCSSTRAAYPPAAFPAGTVHAFPTFLGCPGLFRAPLSGPLVPAGSFPLRFSWVFGAPDCITGCA